MKTPFAPRASPETVTPVTLGRRTSGALPFTAKPEASVTAWLPRPSDASLLVASRIIPELSVSAEAPTERPSGSASAVTTV